MAARAGGLRGVTGAVNIILATNTRDKLSGQRVYKASSHMPLDDRYLQCGKTYGEYDERTERRPTCLTCRDVFDKSREYLELPEDSGGH